MGLFVTQWKLTDTLCIPQEFAIVSSSYLLHMQQPNVFFMLSCEEFDRQLDYQYE